MRACLVPDVVEDDDALLDLLKDAVDLALQLPTGAHGIRRLISRRQTSSSSSLPAQASLTLQPVSSALLRRMLTTSIPNQTCPRRSNRRANSSRNLARVGGGAQLGHDLRL